MKTLTSTALALLALSLVAPQAPLAALPVAVITADLDDDPSCPLCADLAIADRRGRAVVIRFGGGDGSFGAPILLPVPKPPQWVATGDCDGDDDEDVFAVYHGPANLSVFVNQQVQGNPGVFAAASGSPFNVDRRAGFVLAADDQGNKLDLDRDGVLDLVVAGRRAVTTLRGDGACGFSVLQSDVFANKPVGVAAADFDGVDGPDLAIADASGLPTFLFGAAVTVLQNDASGGFPATCTAPACRQYVAQRKPTSIVAVDLNAAGGVDLLFTNLRGGGQAGFDPVFDGLGVLFSTGSGVFGATVLLGSHGKNPRQVVAGDFTGDGTPDVVVVNRGSATITSFAGPAGAFLGSTDVGGAPVALAAGQLDVLANGNLDVVVARQRARDLAVCLGGGDGSFSCSPLPEP